MCALVCSFKLSEDSGKGTCLTNLLSRCLKNDMVVS
jgi:hypothetical protein